MAANTDGVAGSNGAPLAPDLGGRRLAQLVTLAIAVICALSFSGLNLLHTPSVFDSLLQPSRDQRAATLFGHGRYSRGDEFLVETPIALGQARSGLGDRVWVGPSLADRGGDGQDADVSAYAPGSVRSLLYRPFNGWFFVLSPERAVIARSWSVLFFAFSALLLFVRRLNPRLSTLEACALSVSGVLSPPMMWWFTTANHLSVSYGVLVGVMLTVQGSRRRVIGASALAGYFTALGALTTYPAFFLTTGLVSALGCFSKYRRLGFRVLRVCVAGVCAVGIAVLFYVSNRVALQAVLHTVYPGHRVSSSGEDTWLRAMTGPFSRFLLDDRPTGFANSPEVSSSLFVFPVVCVLVALTRGSRPFLRSLCGVGLGFVILSGWASGLMPTAIGRVLGFGRVPGTRTSMGLMVASIGFGAVLLGADNDSPMRKIRGVRLRWAAASVVGLGVCALVVAEGFELRRRVGPSILSGRDVLLYSALFVFVMGFVVLARSGGLRAVLVAVFTAWLTAGVHPLSRGLGPSVVVEADIRKIAKAEPGAWASNGDVSLDAMLMASGVRSLSGVYFTPDRHLWAVLDPSGDLEDEWNRYAHVVFRFHAGIAEFDQPAITAIQDDAVAVEIGSCRGELRSLRLRFVLSKNPLESQCLLERHVVDPGALHVYELVAPAP